MTKRWAWIGGWGIQPRQFQQHVEQIAPDWQHLVVPPTDEAVRQTLDFKPERIGAYSLGSLLLLRSLAQVPAKIELYCYAPILAFCAEEAMGGTTPRGSLDAIRKRLNQSPDKALKLFYRLAGLKNFTSGSDLPYSNEWLRWGLDALNSYKAKPPPAERKVECILGEHDPLIDSQIFTELSPELTLAPGGHDYHDLITTPCLNHD
ncbi:MAG: hypothetical protein ACPGSB_11705 [Opitutales bacterium]